MRRSGRSPHAPSETTKAAPGFARRGLVGNCLECLRRGALDDRGKRLWIGYGDVRQNLAVQDDVRLLQASDEARVRDAVQPRRRVDPRDPERAEVAAAHAAAPGRLHHRALDGLDRALVGAVTPAAEALRELQDAISPATSLESTLDAHCFSPRSTTGDDPEARRGPWFVRRVWVLLVLTSAARTAATS